jgi:hypothetical protein
MQREIFHCTWWLVGHRQSRENKKKSKHTVFSKQSVRNSISNYLSAKNISEMEKQLSLAVQEANKQNAEQ